MTAEDREQQRWGKWHQAGCVTAGWDAEKQYSWSTSCLVLWGLVIVSAALHISVLPCKPDANIIPILQTRKWNKEKVIWLIVQEELNMAILCLTVTNEIFSIPWTFQSRYWSKYYHPHVTNEESRTRYQESVPGSTTRRVAASELVWILLSAVNTESSQDLLV